jgi:hypothetical protein
MKNERRVHGLRLASDGGPAMSAGEALLVP